MINNEIMPMTKSLILNGNFTKLFLLFNYSISIDESLKILGLKKENLTKSNLIQKYKNLISKNNPYKSGSFYIQCKIFNAKEKLIPLCNKQTIKNSFSNFSINNNLYQFKISKNKTHL